ncbi:mevalonate kinase [Vaginisenegalia massiliensis]|uniref:mevalonate kinase n=1 Tax=Vaginisenegalia massiliensis TaxID=2058294 RepID=UPI001F15243F|nr:mevalonate kinase [Vaginisenegalia massiliensis]
MNQDTNNYQPYEEYPHESANYESMRPQADSSLNAFVEAEMTKANKTGRGQAHSKIILMGEHAVVYDFPAIALPFNKVSAQAQVSGRLQAPSLLDCQYYHGPLQEAPSHLANLVKAVELTRQSFRFPLEESLNIRIDSTIPQERGMGSSAAVCVALVRAICDYYNTPISPYQLQFIVNQAEVIAHESTSGIDTLMTSTSQPIIYRKSKKPHAFPLKLNAYLIVADSGMAGQTKLAVHQVAKLRQAKPAFVKEAMDSIGGFVQKAYHAIQDHDVFELGRLMTYNHYYLNQLGISNQGLDRIVNAAWLAGALGAKLTGGGLGGCVIALAATSQKAQEVAEAMKVAGAAQTWTTSLY